MAIIDLLAVLPFYLPFIGLDLRAFRAVRLMRIFRLMKIGRYSSALQMIVKVLRARKEELLISISLLAILWLVSSVLLYYVERDVQPNVFDSIPAAMWWSIATITTVGYGDVYPVTVIGRILAAVSAVIGIAILAIPTGILSAGFVQEFSQQEEGQDKCPHCGGALRDRHSKD